MKTSNKLLLGLFALIVVSMITGTLRLKRDYKKHADIQNSTTTIQTDSTTNDSDSASVHISIN